MIYSIQSCLVIKLSLMSNIFLCRTAANATGFTRCSYKLNSWYFVLS